MKPPEPPYYAQNGEDRIAERIFRKIGTTNRYAVEFGADDGLRKSNTAYFRLTQGWDVTLFDVEPRAECVTRARITAENVNEVFADHGVPVHFDLLSIDIDGNDLWVWQALLYEPRVVIIEYNPRWRARKSRVIPYHPDFQWDKSDYYGASILALVTLGIQKGYTLTASTRSNLIFTRAGLMPVQNLSRVRRATHRKMPDPHDRRWLVYR